MFISSESNEPAERYARAVGRIVFGAVALLGAAIFVERILHLRDPHAAKVLGATWTLAFVAGWVARQLVAALAKRDDAGDLLAVSFAVPAVGVALLLPLTLHLPVALALGVGVDAFDTWAELSLYVTAPAHLTFAFLAALRATRLAQGRPAISTRRIYTITLIVSAIPFFISSLLVGFTGLAIIPLLDHMPRMIERELTPPLPTAIVLS